MTVQRERLDRRLTELERKSGTAQGIRIVIRPTEISEAGYAAWRREHVEPLEREGQVIVVHFVSPSAGR